MKPIQATSVAFKEGAILITGEPGTGKSILAWGLIQRYGARLISDDVTMVGVRGKKVYAMPPTHMRGCIALRGIGIITGQKTARRVPVVCVIHVTSKNETQGMEKSYADVGGYAVRRFFLNINDSESCLKARTAFQVMIGKITLFSDLSVVKRNQVQKGVKK